MAEKKPPLPRSRPREAPKQREFENFWDPLEQKPLRELTPEELMLLFFTARPDEPQRLGPGPLLKVEPYREQFMVPDTRAPEETLSEDQRRRIREYRQQEGRT